MRILVLGASGMLGNVMLRVMFEAGEHDVLGTSRTTSLLHHISPELAKRIVTGVDVEHIDGLINLFTDIRPEIVINCIGLVKQLAKANDTLQVLPINSLLPHRLARMCALVGARLIHISTDCVFSGRKGNYLESDLPDAEDLYGRSKLLGEVNYHHTITLRTSIIGHELASPHGLIGWFLAQDGPVKGYRQAIFSGLPTVELSRVVRDVILSRPSLFGVYHVGSEPISKYDLLKLVAEVYGKDIEIEPDYSSVIDRSLNSRRFRDTTGYVAPSWRELVVRMRDYQ